MLSDEQNANTKFQNQKNPQNFKQTVFKVTVIDSTLGHKMYSWRLSSLWLISEHLSLSERLAGLPRYQTLEVVRASLKEHPYLLINLLSGSTSVFSLF